MIVVNLFGAPGSGKSTGAAYLFSKLKLRGINVELVTEFAKNKVYEENKAVFQDQLYILGKQEFKLSRIKDKVDIAVIDSPILLSLFYGNNIYPSFNQLVKEVFDNYQNLNFFINREKVYNPNGRFQTEEESNKISQQLKEILQINKINYLDFPGTEDGYNDIIKILENYPLSSKYFREEK